MNGNENKNPERQIQGGHKITQLWGRNKEIIRLWSTGLYTQQEIADIIGLTQDTISKILNSELGRQQIEMLDGVADLETVDLIANYRALAHVALSVQEDMLLDENRSDMIRNRIADKIQDRAGYAPVSRNMNLNVNAGLSKDELNSIKERAQEIREESRALQNEEDNNGDH